MALDGTQHACYPHAINVGPTMLDVVHRQRWEDLNASLVYSYFNLSVPPMEQPGGDLKQDLRSQVMGPR